MKVVAIWPIWSWFGRFGRFVAGVCFKFLLFGSRHLACWKTSQPLFWRTNKLRPCQTIFLSWMTCFHQNKILIGEQNLFGAAWQKRLGSGKTDTRTLIWFRLKKWFFFIYSQVLCEIVSSFKVRGLFCEILSRLLL